MAEVKKTKGVIAILTGGGDVPGLNPAIRAVTIRANREGYKVIGLRRGWAGIIELIRDNKADNSNCYEILTDDIVNKAGRTGGTFLHTSRTRPSRQIGSGRQTREYRAFGPLVPMAGIRKVEQCFAHGIECIRLPTQVSRARFRQSLDLRARALAVGPEIKQHADFPNGKAEIAGVGDETQEVHVGLRIVAIPAVTLRRRRDKPDLLIMADHALRHSARIGGRADVHSVTRLRRSALVTTLTDDRAIAAAAMTGDRRMPNTG